MSKSLSGIGAVGLEFLVAATVSTGGSALAPQRRETQHLRPHGRRDRLGKPRILRLGPDARGESVRTCELAGTRLLRRLNRSLGRLQARDVVVSKPQTGYRQIRALAG